MLKTVFVYICDWCGKTHESPNQRLPVGWDYFTAYVDMSTSDRSLYDEAGNLAACSPGCRNGIEDAHREAKWAYANTFDKLCPRRIKYREEHPEEFEE